MLDSQPVIRLSRSSTGLFAEFARQAAEGRSMAWQRDMALRLFRSRARPVPPLRRLIGAGLPLSHRGGRSTCLRQASSILRLAVATGHLCGTPSLRALPVPKRGARERQFIHPGRQRHLRLLRTGHPLHERPRLCPTSGILPRGAGMSCDALGGIPQGAAGERRQTVGRFGSRP